MPTYWSGTFSADSTRNKRKKRKNRKKKKQTDEEFISRKLFSELKYISIWIHFSLSLLSLLRFSCLVLRRKNKNRIISKRKNFYFIFFTRGNSPFNRQISFSTLAESEVFETMTKMHLYIHLKVFIESKHLPSYSK